MHASKELAARKGPEGVYGCLFKDMPAWSPAGQSPADAIEVLASKRYGKSPDNDRIPAAYTFFGQFVTHDVTFDTRLDPRSAASPRLNRRTPALDLDSVYGRGPVDQPYLYELARPDRFCIPHNAFGELDLPRNDDASIVHPSAGGDANLRRTALIGDPRNDENLLVSQLHLAFLHFHNARIDEGFSFEDARRLTTWHYQWVLVHDFLPLLCGDDVVRKLTGEMAPRLKLHPPLLPYEFTLAAFRSGHTMVGDDYHLNDVLETDLDHAPIPMFQNIGAEFAERDRVAANSLEGERALPRDWTVQWDRFLDIGPGKTQWSRRIDSLLAPSLQYLPIRNVSERERSLAYLTMWHGYQQRLPAGQVLAAELELEIAGSKDARDPLWLYLLDEADSLGNGGRHLGPLGATLVGEVLIGLLQHDENSFVRREPAWEPTLVPPGARFGLADFLKSAGALITAAQWSGRPIHEPSIG